ncbi:unnamed protein product [Paramecium sonneborni]|uniref:Uncharacterized protein n=1 Tax=Paramecium sonneborni TaxID=65129 RepID=A0A8S1LKZ8_9CILI|nr:unnamed protein product [Paramecium sonneborni]
MRYKKDQIYQDLNYHNWQKIDKLENQNVEYRVIADRIPFLEEKLQDMRSKISAYETLIIFKDSPDVELRKHFFALSQELEQLKSNQHIDNYKEENQTKFNTNQSLNSFNNYHKLKVILKIQIMINIFEMFEQTQKSIKDII